MWAQIAIAIVMAVIAYAIQPKPAAPKPAALTDLQLPTAEEGRPIPIAFGTVRVRSANVLWYGDLSTKAIKKGGK